MIGACRIRPEDSHSLNYLHVGMCETVVCHVVVKIPLAVGDMRLAIHDKTSADEDPYRAVLKLPDQPGAPDGLIRTLRNASPFA